DLVTANVPFAFVVGSRVLPPGNYMIEDATEGATVVRVERQDGTASAFTFTIAAPESQSQGDPQPQLAFAKVGDAYYLKSIDLPDGKRESRRPAHLIEQERAAIPAETASR